MSRQWVGLGMMVGVFLCVVAPSLSHVWTQNGTNGPDQLGGHEHRDIINGFAGIDEIFGREGDDDLEGNGGGDAIGGDSDADSISGGQGTDNLEGRMGWDTVNGDDDNDSIDGGQGNDVLKGSNGPADFVDGRGSNSGTDVVNGGAGDFDVCFVDIYDTWSGCDKLNPPS